MADIHTEFTDAPICPHCGVAHEDAFEWGGRDEGERACWKCKKPFKWERDIEVTYTTYPVLAQVRVEEPKA